MWGKSWFVLALLLTSFFPFYVLDSRGQESPTTETKDGFTVTWFHLQSVPYVYNISIENLEDNVRKVSLTTLFNETTFEVSGLRNLGFYEWKEIQHEVKVWDHAYVSHQAGCLTVEVLGSKTIVCTTQDATGTYAYPVYERGSLADLGLPIYDSYDNESWTGSVWDVVGSHVEIQVYPDWKPAKSQFFNLTANAYRENFGVITIGKQETKWFRLEFDAPFTQTTKGWGSKGRLMLGLNDTVFDPWWDVNWLYRRQLTFNNSRSTENLTEFTVLVHLTGSEIDWTLVQNAGQDIRFLDSDDTTSLDFEIEEWDDTVEAWIWVEVPQIDDGSTTDHILMYYGNGAASDGQDMTGTWSNSYNVVNHLRSGLLGSSPNQYNATNQGATSVSGLISDAYDFDTSTDYIDFGNYAETLAALTVEIWVNRDAIGAYGGLSNNWYTSAVDEHHLLRFESDNTWILYLKSGGNDFTEVSVTTLTDTTNWHYIVGSYEANDFIYVYLNGTEEPTPSAAPGNLDASAQSLWIGRYANPLHNFDGQLDEYRVSSVRRSAEWLEAQYYSMIEDFITFGAQQGLTFYLTVFFDGGISLVYVNGSSVANGTETGYTPGDVANVTSVASSNFVFIKHDYDGTPTLDNPEYIVFGAANLTLWSITAVTQAVGSAPLMLLIAGIVVALAVIAVAVYRKFH